MVIHPQISLCQSTYKVLLRRTPLVGSSLGKDVPDVYQFVIRNGNLVAAHPSLGDSNRLGRTEVYHHPIVLGRHQLPCASHQVQTDNLALIKGFLECIV